MHIIPNETPETELERTNREAAAHASAARVAALNEYCTGYDFVERSMYQIEHVYGVSAPNRDEANKLIMQAEFAVASGGKSAAELASIGYELMRLATLCIVDDKGPFTYMAVLFEGQVSGKRGYGIVNLNTLPLNMQIFTPRELLMQPGGEQMIEAIYHVVRKVQEASTAEEIKPYFSS